MSGMWGRRHHQTRREYIALAIGALTATAGCVTTTNTSDPWDQTFGAQIVERIKFDNGGAMHVTLGEKHGLDAFGIWHAADDEETRGPIASYGMGIGSSKLPRYSGTVSLNFATELKKADAAFPSNKFQLIGLTGTTFVWDVKGRVRFVVPEELMPGNRITLDPDTSMITPTP